MPWKVRQLVGLREIDDGLWLVSLADLDLGLIDVLNRCFTPADLQITGTSEHKVSTMCPV